MKLSDTQQVTAARKHAIPLGALVEMENGVRLFVVDHTRDCDMTPMYSLAMDDDADVIRAAASARQRTQSTTPRTASPTPWRSRTLH